MLNFKFQLQLQLQVSTSTSTPTAEMVWGDLIDLNVLYKSVSGTLCSIPHSSGDINFFRGPGPARVGRPGPPLEVQVSTWTSTPIAEMVWYDFVLNVGYQKGMTRFLKILHGSDAMKV